MNVMENSKLLNKTFLKNISKKLNSEIVNFKRFSSGRASPTFNIVLKNEDEYVLKLYMKRGMERYSNTNKILKLFSANTMIPNFIGGGEWYNGKYLVMKKLEGEDLENSNLSKWSTKNLDNLFFEIGKLTAELHSVQNKRFGKIINPRYKSWRSYLWDKNSKRLNQDVKNSEFSFLYESIKLYLKNNFNLIPEIKKGSFIHDDIQPQNILAKNRRLTGIIDFDLAFWGDPFFELPYCDNIASYLVSSKYKNKIEKQFYKGYKKIRKIDKKLYKRTRDYYDMSRYIRYFGGFASLRTVLPHQLCEELKKKFIQDTKILLKK
tara:strand:- start:272 stop:1231 length:960 start_codon:yes stop_codon:yes gene_type:complete